MSELKEDKKATIIKVLDIIKNKTRFIELDAFVIETKEIIEEAKHQKISEEQTREALCRLRRNGEIYEPQYDKIRLLI